MKTFCETASIIIVVCTLAEFTLRPRTYVVENNAKRPNFRKQKYFICRTYTSYKQSH